jgi:hypothetical protein
MAKIIRFREASRKIAVLREWLRVRPDHGRSPAAWERVRGTIVRGLAEYQRRRLIRIAEVFQSRNDRPA